MIDTKEARKLASDWAIPDGDIRNLLEDACDELDRLYVMEVEHRAGAADECDDAVEELLERMVEAYVGYQSPVDRGLAQQVEGMRLALNIWLASPTTSDSTPAGDSGEAQGGKEPAAWQYRYVDFEGNVSPWTNCRSEDADNFANRAPNAAGRYEVRELYLHPPKPAEQEEQ